MPRPNAVRAARTAARPAADAAGARIAPDARGIESVCGTRLEAAADALEGHAARLLDQPLPTPHSTDAGEIAVLEDDGRFFYTDKGGNVIADLVAIGQAFYRTHGDDYDCLAVYLSSGLSTWLGSPTAIAASFLLRNSIQGIGVDPYDIGANMGSPSRLQSMLSMNGLDRYPADPFADISGDSFSSMDVLGHEFAHRWLAYAWIDSAGTPSHVLLGRALQHWSFYFDSDASLMEGGNWATPAPDSFRIDQVSERYGNLDLYLMGLQSKAATPPFFTIHDTQNFDPPGAYNATTFPVIGMSCHARAHFWTVDDVEALNGPRVPDAASAPHSFRVGVILVVPRGQDASPADLAKLDNMRGLFPGYFATATQGLGAIDATLDSRAGTVAIAHAPIRDVLAFAGPIQDAAQVTIQQAGIPIALDASSVMLHWRLGTAGPFQDVPMSPGASDSFTVSIPAQPGYTGIVQYFLSASSDSAGIDATDPPAGAAAPHAFAVGPDFVLPVIVHTPIAEQGETQMPVTILARITDNVALASAAVEWGVDGALGNLSPMAPVGRDSFAVAIGAGVTEGHGIDYRIRATDSSGNVAYHQSLFQAGGPWPMHVGRDWVSDLENGASGFFHTPYWFSYRDAWHLTQESSWPPGGTAWKCGDDAPRPYPVHQDANLYLPLLAITPGTKLTFHHRYDLEEADNFYAWDGARVEAQVGSGPWTPMTPDLGYSHVFLLNSNPFQRNTPCWSGNSGGWRAESIDLSSLSPGPARIRFRMLADDFASFDGWLVDAIRVDYPGDVNAVPTSGPDAGRAPWPNPVSDRVRLELSLPRAGHLEWALFDLAGRRVATLASGAFPAGAAPLEARIPAALRPGVYLSRLEAPGVATRVDRIAVVR